MPRKHLSPPSKPAAANGCIRTTASIGDPSGPWITPKPPTISPTPPNAGPSATGNHNPRQRTIVGHLTHRSALRVLVRSLQNNSAATAAIKIVPSDPHL